MLQLMGRRYISEYIVSCIVKEREQDLFRMYIADSVRGIGEHKVMTKSYADLLDIYRKPRTSASQRSEEEIRSTILNKLNAGKQQEAEGSEAD